MAEVFRKRLRATLLVGLIVLIAAMSSAISQSQVFLKGTVKWSSGVPAQGLEVRLVGKNNLPLSVFTDSSGYFAFYDVTGQPGNFRINVLTAGGIVADMPVGNVPVGGTAHEIILK